MKIRIPLLFVLLFPGLTLAATDEIGYEAIVNELSKSRVRQAPQARAQQTDPFAQAKIHSGVGFSQSFIRVRNADGEDVQGFHRGIQASLGIDLLSKNWFAEAAVRSFGETEIDTDVVVQLREFDLKIVYRSNPERLLGYRAGLGLATRNVSITEAGSERKFSTPSSILLTGVDANLSQVVSLGGEVSYRSSLTSESDDRSALDFALRLNANF